MGEQGAFLFGYGMVSAYEAGPVVETTGAGDAFNGALAVALSEGKSAVDAVRFGCATAAISVTRPGTAPSIPTRDEVGTAVARLRLWQGVAFGAHIVLYMLVPSTAYRGNVHAV